MTNLEIILLAVLWIISGIFLMYKLLQLDKDTFSNAWNDDKLVFIIALLFVTMFSPVIWVIFMFYHTLIKDWSR